MKISRGFGLVSIVVVVAALFVGSAGLLTYINKPQLETAVEEKVIVADRPQEAPTEEQVEVILSTEEKVAEVPKVETMPNVTVDLYEGRYVTPNGTPTIKLPDGWTTTPGSIFYDTPPGAVLFFTNKNLNGAFLHVSVSVPMKEQYSPDIETDRLIELHTKSSTIQGKSLHGELIKKERIQLGKAQGYTFEINKTTSSGDWKIFYVYVATKEPDYLYVFYAHIPISEWENHKAAIHGSSNTLWIP